MNIGMHVSFQSREFSLDACPGVGLLDHMVALSYFFFKETSVKLLKKALPQYI